MMEPMRGEQHIAATQIAAVFGTHARLVLRAYNPWQKIQSDCWGSLAGDSLLPSADLPPLSLSFPSPSSLPPMRVAKASARDALEISSSSSEMTSWLLQSSSSSSRGRMRCTAKKLQMYCFASWQSTLPSNQVCIASRHVSSSDLRAPAYFTWSSASFFRSVQGWK